jgi:hypothetical protein
MRRIIAPILIGICVAGGAAACSSAGASGSHGGSQASGTEQGMTAMRQLAHCIRSHGEPGFPDPIINPVTGAPDFPQDAPHVPENIQQACQSIANRLPPDAQQSQPPTARSMQGLVRFAHCMRSHGVPNWPDPNALGEFPLTSQMATQFKAHTSANSACIRYVPGGAQYINVVQAAPQPAAGGSGNG